MIMKFLLFPCLVMVASCAPKTYPEEAVHIAHTYTKLKWLPEQRHIRHGKDSAGIEVRTPDISLRSTGDRRGWWKAGEIATGMPYKWGGFDTPETFLAGIAMGKKAGDIANTYKVRGNDAVVSKESVGIDCSGFISRCWGLDRHVSTRDLPSICDPVSWEDLRMGDILLKSGHVLMFYTYQDQFVIGYEAGPIPTWRARQCAITVSFLKGDGYSPYRYKNMAEPMERTVPESFVVDSTEADYAMGRN